MVLRGTYLTGARIEGLVADGTQLTACRLDDAVLCAARIGDWCGPLIPPGDDPLAGFPSLAADAELDHSDFDLRAAPTSPEWRDASMDPDDLDMANPEDGWTQFFRQGFIYSCEMRRVDLSRATLRGLEVFGTCLDGAVLRQSDLRGAHLEHVTLVGADLSGADLRGARLVDVDMTGVTMPEASLLERCTFDRVKGV